MTRQTAVVRVACSKEGDEFNQAKDPRRAFFDKAAKCAGYAEMLWRVTNYESEW